MTGTDLWIICGKTAEGIEFEMGWHGTEDAASVQLEKLELDFSSDGWSYWVEPPTIRQESA